MNNLSIRFLALWVCCLCSALGLRGQTITGPSSVCKGSSGSYTATGGPAGTASYEWHSPGGGTLTSPNNLATVSVLWGISGTTSISVDAKDASGAVIGTGNSAVTVASLPTPTITSNVRVGCQIWIPPPRNPEGQPVGDPSVLDDAQGCIKVCESSPVTYTAAGGAGSTYTWTVAGGTPATATGNTLYVNWGVAGSGNITVTETTASGCVGTRQICIEKIQKPRARFFEVSQPSATTITTCLNNVLYFQDASIGSASSPIVEWIWDFGDGTTMTSLTSTTESHAYSNPGPYRVTLTVKNACGCTDQYALRVEVSRDQGVKIVCPAVVCEGTQATYSLDPSGPGCSRFMWSASGGTLTTPPNAAAATVVWNNVDPTGFGYVNFDASGCGIRCPGVTTIKVPVIQTRGTIAGPTVVCPNSQALFNLPQWPSTVFTWTVAAGSVPVDLVQTDQNNQIAVNTRYPGNFVLRCNYTNTLLNCSGTAEIHVQVLPPDSIVGPKIVCLNSAANVSLFSGASGNWTLSQPDGSVLSFSGVPAIAPVLTQIGSYSVSVRGSFCSPAPLVIRVNALPPAPNTLVGPAEACFGDPTEYTAGAPLTGTTFSWAVSSGSVAPASNPSTFATFSGGSPAIIRVFRTTVDEAHCNSLPLEMEVFQPEPSGFFTGVDTVCPSTAYPFSFSYALGDTYEWTLSDPDMGSVEGAGNTKDVNILWNQQSGNVTIKLRVTRCGAPYFFEKTVHVRGVAAPVITLNKPIPLCRGDVFLAFTGIPGMATWDWGDGSALTPANIHSYTALSGGNLSYTISVEVANPFGCPGTVRASLPVTVLPAPVAQISPIGPIQSCTAPNEVLTATLQSGYEPTNLFTWYKVGTGAMASCGVPPGCTYTVTSLGSYYVEATGVNGCKANSNVVQFDSTGCAGGPAACVLTPNGTVGLSGTSACGHITLNGSYSSPAPTTAIAWDWEGPSGALNVGTTSTSYDADFAVAGVYPVTYVVTFNDGTNTCTRRQTANVTVPLVAEMGYTALCNGSNNGYDVTLQDHSNYYPPYAPQRYDFWVDGSFVGTVYPPANSYLLSSLPAGPHDFKTVTYYSPTESCESVASFTVPQTPVAGFTADSVVTCVKDQAVAFTNTSTGTDLTYLWDFGDGPTNTAENPYKVYNATFSYPVVLTAADKYGCQSNTSLSVLVLPNDIAGGLITPSAAVVCSGTPVTLQYFPGSTGVFPSEYTWLNGSDVLYTTNIDNTTVFSSGAYWVKGRNAIGCKVSTDKVTINVNEVPDPVISGNIEACQDQTYTLYGYAGAGVTYTWRRNGAVVSSNDSYTESTSAVGTITYTLTLTTTEFGVTCSKTSAPFVVTVNPPPPPPSTNFSVGPCDPYIVTLYASGPGGVTYNWSNGTAGSTVTAQGGGAFGVYMTDANGCKSHAVVDVPKDPRAYLWIFPTGCYEFCDNSLPRTITGPVEHFNFWSWLQYGSPVLFNTLAPTATAVQSYDLNSAGIYNLELGNIHCQNIRSEDMIVTTKACGNNCGKDITFQYQEFRQNGPCSFLWQFRFNNALPYGVNASLSASTGILSPTFTTINPGFNLLNVSYNPPAGWGGGIVTFTMSYTDPQTGEQYSCKLDIKIPPCKPGPRPAPGNGARMAGADGMSGTAAAGLWLVPNPASDATRAEYVLNAGTRAGSVEVYDMVGRLLSSTAIEGQDVSGTVSIPLADYVPGVYLVVLKEEGRITQQSRLTVAH